MTDRGPQGGAGFCAWTLHYIWVEIRMSYTIQSIFAQWQWLIQHFCLTTSLPGLLHRIACFTLSFRQKCIQPYLSCLGPHWENQKNCFGSDSDDVFFVCFPDFFCLFFPGFWNEKPPKKRMFVLEWIWWIKISEKYSCFLHFKFGLLHPEKT